MDPERTKKRLQKKLEKRRNKLPEPTTDSTESVDFMKMLNEVNKMFKTNPNMIHKVSKCVNNIMENKELMETLVSKANIDIDNDEIGKDKIDNDKIDDQTLFNNILEALVSKNSINIGDDDQTVQTLHSNSLGEKLAALSNESKQ